MSTICERFHPRIGNVFDPTCRECGQPREHHPEFKVSAENTTETAKHILATVRDAKKSLQRIMDHEMPYRGES